MVIDYDKLAADYARHRQVQPEVLKNLVANGEMDTAAQVLEVGCGTGNYAVALESIVRCAYWGIDPSAQMLLRAKKRSHTIRFQ